MTIILDFCAPYIGFLYGAVHNVQQTLEGLNSSALLITGKSIDADSYFSQQDTLIILGMLMLYWARLGHLDCLSCLHPGTHKRGSNRAGYSGLAGSFQHFWALS
jgi:hypothetical protein